MAGGESWGMKLIPGRVVFFLAISLGSLFSLAAISSINVKLLYIKKIINVALSYAC